MHRRTELEHHVVGDVDDSADRTQARATQALLHPERRCGVWTNATDHAANEFVTTDGCVGSVAGCDADRERIRDRRRNRFDHRRMQGLSASSSHFTSYALHAHRVATIRREIHFEDGVIEAERTDQVLPWLQIRWQIVE